VNFVCLLNHENMVGAALLKGFLPLLNIEVAILTNPSSGIGNSAGGLNSGLVSLCMENDNFEELIKVKLGDDNIFIFNSKFINELKEVDINYSDKICGELNHLFRTIKALINILRREDKRGKFLFITTNPSISHLSEFPISPIYDEAVHSLIRSLAKEFKSVHLAFHGICIEPIFEMLDKNELRDYRKKMKVYAMQKSPIKLEVLMAFIKNLALTDLRLASGNILYIAEGLDQANL